MKYFIIPTSELYLVDFSQLGSCDYVPQTLDYVRKSIDGSQSVLTWYDDDQPQTPSFLTQLSYYETYVNEEIFTVIDGSNWVN